MTLSTMACAYAGDSAVAGLSALRSDELNSALVPIKDTRDLTIEVFYLPSGESPVQRPPDAVDVSPAWHVTIEEGHYIEQVVAIVSALSIAEGEGINTDPVLKLRFRRNGRVVLEAVFTDKGLRNPRGQLMTPALLNGRLAMVHYDPVAKLLEFAERRSGLPAHNFGVTLDRSD